MYMHARTHFQSVFQWVVPAVGWELHPSSLALLAVKCIGNRKKSAGAVACVDLATTSTTVLHALQNLHVRWCVMIVYQDTRASAQVVLDDALACPSSGWQRLRHPPSDACV